MLLFMAGRKAVCYNAQSLGATRSKRNNNDKARGVCVDSGGGLASSTINLIATFCG